MAGHAAQFVGRACAHDFPVRQHGDAVADGEQAVKIMGHHIDGDAQRRLQLPDQQIKSVGADRVETGGRLVEKHHFRVKRQRPRQSSALAHAAGQLGRVFIGVVRVQPNHFQLQQRQLIHHALRHVVMFAHRHLNILQNVKRAEQGAILKQNPQPRIHPGAFAGRQPADVAPENLDFAAPERHQTGYAAHQHRLACAGTADHAKHLATINVKIESFKHFPFAKVLGQVANADHHVPAGFLRRRHLRFRGHLLRPLLYDGFGHALNTPSPPGKWRTARPPQSPERWPSPRKP